ncbi:MAG: hypothetical protein CME60_05635 [Halobacteriovoraceae bacterium]|jgi:hypothetical protein|nr:hypothetical protein [Halobacteriovoraceae bacterium]|tara:strand:+ start:51242 stop:52027 length:786 start_codon:yes stop_codon:yes gene_type:complete
MKKIILTLSLFLISISHSLANEFNCTVNISHSNPSASDSRFPFTFNSEKDTSKSLQFKDYRFLVWKSDASLMIKIKGGVFKEALSVQFGLDQKQARFHYGKDFDFDCSQKAIADSSHTLKKIDGAKENIVVKVTHNLTFPYNQSEEVELMRTLYFQDEKIYSESSKLIPKLPWCSLRIQLSRNEDTTVKAGEEFIPVSYDGHNNNSYFTTHSYSFVDFASGKKRGSKRLYNPFMFNCNVLRGMDFNGDTFASIVGNYLKIK